MCAHTQEQHSSKVKFYRFSFIGMKLLLLLAIYRPLYRQNRKSRRYFTIRTMCCRVLCCCSLLLFDVQPSSNIGLYVQSITCGLIGIYTYVHLFCLKLKGLISIKCSIYNAQFHNKIARHLNCSWLYYIGVTQIYIYVDGIS
jgi:hypothetical protein